MKALITGSGGFVGKYLRNFLEKKEIEVIGLDRKEGKGTNFTADLLDYEKINSIILEVKPDWVFHLAAQSSVRKSFENPKETKEINVKGTSNILESIKENCKESKVLFISSSEVYGIPNKLPVNEETEIKPINPYGESKLEAEKLALNSGLNVIISRSFAHIGPGQAPIFVCSEFAKKIADIEKEGAIHTGNLDVLRDFTDVRDVVEAYYLAMIKGEKGDIFNICSGKSHSIKQVLDILIRLSTSKIKVVQDKEKFRKVDIPNLIGDNSKFRLKTDWKPKISIEQSLKETLEFWREEKKKF